MTYLGIPLNRFKELPDLIGGLKNLKSLDISSNSLKELPDFIGDLKNLTSLSVSSNTLKELPGFIGGLKNLTSLNISSNSLKELPDFIGGLKNLTSLDISSNTLKELPDFIGDLKNLTSLSISSNALKELPDFIGDLKNLTSLNISSNALKELPDFIGGLKNLTSLDISSNALKELPDFLGKLRNLFHLNISNSVISHIPKQLLDLDIPFYMSSFGITMKRGINYYNTELKKMDKSLFEQSYDVIKEFYKSDLIELKECKLILLGDGQAGKTCLVERLINNKYPPQSPPTDGILIKDWDANFASGENAKIKVLDFGGQEVMHSMHTCFLTSRTVYLVVLDGRQDMLNDLLARNWMENIKTFAPNSPVIIVISKVDDEGNPNASLNGNELKKEYQNLLFVEKTSAKKGTNIEGIKERIYYAIEHSSGYKYYFNTIWMNIKSEIESMQSDYIKDNVYDEICERYDLHNDYFKKSLLDWFKDLGVSYYYSSEDFSPTKEKYRVLNPAWLTNGIYTLILKTPTSTGLLSHAVIKATLTNNIINQNSVNYSDEEIEFILYVMRQYEISLKTENSIEFIPSKLNKEKPEFDFPIMESLHISWEAKYIPNIILHRLMVRNYDKIDRKIMWRTGAVFSDIHADDYLYKVLIEKNDTQIDLYVNSTFDEPRIYLQGFRDRINTSLKEIESVKEYIYYNIDTKGSGKEPYEDVLIQYTKEPNREIYLSDIKDYAKPYEILKQIFTDKFIKEKETKMKYNLSNAKIGELNIIEEGDYIAQKARAINNK